MAISDQFSMHKTLPWMSTTANWFRNLVRHTSSPPPHRRKGNCSRYRLCNFWTLQSSWTFAKLLSMLLPCKSTQYIWTWAVHGSHLRTLDSSSSGIFTHLPLVRGANITALRTEFSTEKTSLHAEDLPRSLSHYANAEGTVLLLFQTWENMAPSWIGHHFPFQASTVIAIHTISLDFWLNWVVFLMRCLWYLHFVSSGPSTEPGT